MEVERCRLDVIVSQEWMITAWPRGASEERGPEKCRRSRVGWTWTGLDSPAAGKTRYRTGSRLAVWLAAKLPASLPLPALKCGVVEAAQIQAACFVCLAGIFPRARPNPASENQSKVEKSGSERGDLASRRPRRPKSVCLERLASSRCRGDPARERGSVKMTG